MGAAPAGWRATAPSFITNTGRRRAAMSCVGSPVKAARSARRPVRDARRSCRPGAAPSPRPSCRRAALPAASCRGAPAIRVRAQLSPWRNTPTSLPQAIVVPALRARAKACGDVAHVLRRLRLAGHVVLRNTRRRPRRRSASAAKRRCARACGGTCLRTPRSRVRSCRRPHRPPCARPCRSSRARRRGGRTDARLRPSPSIPPR